MNSPASKATQFKPGVSGNSAGRPPLPEHLREVAMFRKQEINALFAKFLRMNRDELMDVVEDPKTEAIDLWICSAIIGGINKKDISNLITMIERMFGRVPQVREEDERTEAQASMARVIVMLPSNGKEAKGMFNSEELSSSTEDIQSTPQHPSTQAQQS